MAAPKQTDARPWSKRKAARHGRPRKEDALDTTEMRAEIVRLVSAGCTITEIAAREDMPDKTLIHKWKRKYPDFFEAMEDAQEACAQAIIEDAVDMVREASESALEVEPVSEKTGKKSGREAPVIPSPESTLTRARIAEIAFKTSVTYAEKIAPKRFGNLVKLSDAALSGAPIVQLVNYGTQATENKGHLGDAEGSEAGPST